MAGKRSFAAEQNKSPLKVKGDHPESIKGQKDPKLAGDFNVSEIIAEINGEVDEIISSRQEWEQRNVRWYRQRYGVRPKRTFPWPGASNISIPTIDKAIKKLTPAYMNLIFGPTKTARFEPTPQQVGAQGDVYKEAEYNEVLLDDLVKNKMSGFFEKMHHITDKMLERGQAIMKVSMEYKTRTKDFLVDLERDLNRNQYLMYLNNLPELIKNDKAIIEMLTMLIEKQGVTLNLSIKDELEQMLKNVQRFKDGEKKFKFTIDIVEAHAPFAQVVNPEDFIIAGDLNDLQSAEMVCHIMRFTEHELRNLARQGAIDKDVTKKILEQNHSQPEQNANRGQRNVTTSLKATQEQYQGSYWYSYGKGAEPIEVREIFFKAVDKQGIPRKYVLLFSPFYHDEPLKFHELDYDDGKWPFVRFPFELTNDGWLAPRGIPQTLDYLATTRDTMHNQKIDRMTVANAPMMKYVTGMVNPANVRYIPGQFIPTKDIRAVEPMVFPNAQTSFIEEERELKAEIEDYLPFVDFSITDAQAGTSKSRTLGEVMAAKQDKADRFSLDAKIFLNAYNEVLEMIWARWMQYGNPEVEVLVEGDPNPVVWKKQYGLRDMRIRPRGTLYNSNPALRMQSAQQDLALAEHPIYGKFVEPYVILREYLKAKDMETVNLKLKPLQQVMQEQQAEAQQMQQLQQQQVQMAVQDKQMEHQFELDKIEKEHQAKMEEIEKEGQAKIGMEALKHKINGNGKGSNERKTVTRVS